MPSNFPSDARNSQEPHWQIASACNNGACVEVAELADRKVGIRSTKAPDNMLVVSLDEFEVFAGGIKAGEFDRLFA
jgi:hypothetical protein